MSDEEVVKTEEVKVEASEVKITEPDRSEIFKRADKIVETLSTAEKSWVASKRIWLNIVTMIGAVVLKVSGYQITGDDTEMIMLVLAGLNIVLTFLSDKKIVFATEKK